VDALLPISLSRSTTFPKLALALPPTPTLLPESLYSTVVASGGTLVMLVVCCAAVRHAAVSGPMPSVTL